MENENNPEKERLARLEEINKNLEVLSAQANEAGDEEDPIVWENITKLQAERYEIMNSNERINLFKERIPDHEEMNEMGMPVDLNTIAFDLPGGKIEDFNELGEKEQSEIKNIIREKQLVWIIQDE